MATSRIFVLCIFLALVQFSLSSSKRERRQLPCDHSLKLILPQLFTHCPTVSCNFSSWGPWRVVPHSEVAVPVSGCKSGKAFFEERNRTVTSGSGCIGKVQEARSVCEFDKGSAISYSILVL